MTTTSQTTRDRIVEGALRLFAERGTTAVSMRELADAAGVTVPGLYYHFASKADLIREVYRARGLGRTPEDGDGARCGPRRVEELGLAACRDERLHGERQR